MREKQETQNSLHKAEEATLLDRLLVRDRQYVARRVGEHLPQSADGLGGDEAGGVGIASRQGPHRRLQHEATLVARPLRPRTRSQV